jgi:asparagine synthase (glutamine-hydrolysing)
VRGGETKWILKRACRRQLPPEILSRPKHGFEIPIDAWLAGPLREQFESCVLDGRARAATLVNQAVARELYRAHLSGMGRHGQVLWSLLMLSRWAERYLAPAPVA